MSITIYRIGKTCIDNKNIQDHPITGSVTVDPGINTGGITCINHKTKEFDIVPYAGQYNAMESQYPKLISDILHSSDRYLELITNSLLKIGIGHDDLKGVEFTMEYTGTWGQFSIGLFTFLSSIHTKILSQDIRGLTLIPPLVGKYFLFDKYKENLRQENISTTKDGFDVKKLISMNNINVSKTELKRLVELEFSEIIPKKFHKAIDKKTGVPKWKYDHTNHMADSLLISCYRHYDFFKIVFPHLSLKLPEYNLIELNGNSSLS